MIRKKAEISKMEFETLALVRIRGIYFFFRPGFIFGNISKLDRDSLFSFLIFLYVLSKQTLTPIHCRRRLQNFLSCVPSFSHLIECRSEFENLEQKLTLSKKILITSK